MNLTFKFITIFLILVCDVYSQNVRIKGKTDKALVGREVLLFDFSDYVTYTQIKKSIDTVDANGYFNLQLQLTNTKPVLIKIGNLTGKLYIKPNFVYGIYFPVGDSLNRNSEQSETHINISVYSKDSLELNALIFDFNAQYNNLFSDSKSAYFSPAKINTVLDTFFVTIKKRYSKIKDIYFKNYIDYSFAAFYSNISRSKVFLNALFIDKKPILYTNYEYMEFLNAHYKGYLKAFASTKNGGTIYNSINTFGNYNDLKNQFRSDKTISNDTLRELLILKGLIDFYYSPEFDKKQVQSVIEQLYNQSVYSQNKKIAFNMLQTTYQLQNGSKAPDFFCYDKSGKQINLFNYKGKYIYLNFFSTQSVNSLKEMQKLFELKKKFNDKVNFLSICTDDSLNAYLGYLKANPKYDWNIYFNGAGNAKANYYIKTLSGYFLINQQMIFAQSPALSPSEGIEYNFNALFRPKKKNTIPGIR